VFSALVDSFQFVEDALGLVLGDTVVRVIQGVVIVVILILTGVIISSLKKTEQGDD